MIPGSAGPITAIILTATITTHILTGVIMEATTEATTEVTMVVIMAERTAGTRLFITIPVPEGQLLLPQVADQALQSEAQPYQ